jgi:hypothetical protein
MLFGAFTSFAYEILFFYGLNAFWLPDFLFDGVM